MIHPFHQVEMVGFYGRYKMLIIDYCMRSDFSIRFPYKVADCQKKQKGFHKVYSDDASPVDTSESLKHFSRTSISRISISSMGTIAFCARRRNSDA